MNEMNDQKRLQLAYNRILKLEEKIKNQTHLSEMNNGSKVRPVAVIGAACRYPGAVNDIESLWESFQNNVNVVKEIPESRWDLQNIFSENKNDPNKTYCRYGAFFDAIDEFDPLFFNISNKEAERMDPQQRLFLQGCWEAFEDAGYNDKRLNGVKCGVYAGSLNCDYTNVLNSTPHNVDLFELMGTQTSILSARISYLLNLKGPSITIDTACSSSLVAIDMAVKAIQSGDIDLALAGGVHLYITPNLYIMMSKAKMLSIDGQSKAFDNNANGFAPGEGMAVVALKSLDKAIADGDQIYGVILGGASNQDGKTNGITAPSSLAQTELELEAYKKLDINPETIGYVEAHGTGTKLGDPIEFEALTRSFGSYTQKQKFCAIGSSKTNFGHTLSAAGVTGVLKALLAMRHKKIPANLNFSKANEHLEYEESPFYINDTLIDWPQQATPRRSAVSSFGFSGTNVHLLLEEAPLITNSDHASTPPSFLLLFSTKTKTALETKISDFKNWLSRPANAAARLEDITITLMRGRSHFKFRSGFVVTSKADLLQQIDNWKIPQSSGVFGTSSEINALINHLKQPANFSNDLFSDSLITLLKHYVNGGSGDWWNLLEKTGARTISLPTYPFEREIFWITPQTVSHQETDNSSSFSLVDSNESTLESQCYQKTFSGDEFYLKDHVVNLRKMLPGVAYLEMARSSGNLCNKPHRVTRIQNVTWKNPIVVDGGPQTVKISLHPNEDGVAFQVFSTNNDNSRGTVHSLGNLIYDNENPQDEHIDVEALRSELTEFLSQKQCYDTFKEKGLQYGSTFKRILNLSYQGDRALATLEGLTSDSVGDALHPGIMDAAMQAVLVLVSQVVEQSGQHYLPYTMEQLEIHHALTRRCHSFVTRRLKASDDPAEYFDVKLTDESGKVLLCVTGLKLVPIQQGSPALRHEAEQLFYAHQLLEADINPLTPTIVENQLVPNQRSDHQPAIIVVGNQSQGSHRLEQSQISQYLPLIEVKQANAFSPYSEGSVQLDLCQPDHAELLLESLSASRIAPEFVLWLVPPASELDHEEQITQFQFLCRLAKYIIQYKTTRMLRLVTLEKTSQQELDCVTAYSGFFKTLAQENPNYIGKHLVFDQQFDSAGMTQAVINELFNREFNPHPVLYIEGKRYKKRLQKLDITPEAQRNKDTGFFKDEGVYLITGGLRGVGLALADEIAQLADANLILLGRSAPSEDSQATINRIQQKLTNATVSVIKADISDSEDTARAVSDVVKRYGRMNGILHCAGIKRDSFILKKTDTEIRDVLLPKITGTVCLDQATREIDLEFFVLFSSIASVFGNAGQSDYAFANGFMDDFAAYRNKLASKGSRSGRTLSINWPLWQTGGMQLDETSFASMNEIFGMRAIDGRLGLKVLQHCLKLNISSVMFMFGDRAKTEKSLRAGLAGDHKEQPTDINHLDHQQRDTILNEAERFIKLLISDEMKIPCEKLDSDAPFENFGMDSVVYMSLNQKLVERFGKLSKTLFYEYQNIGTLADYFVENYLTQLLKITDTQLHEPPKTVVAPEQPAIVEPRIPEPSRPRFKSSAVSIAPSKVQDIAIIGVSGRYPQANTLEEFWQNLLQGKDCVEEIPAERWDHSHYFDKERGVPGKTYSKWGGFIDGHDRFDALFFNISPKEAALIDPQERVFLETSWQTMADAGYASTHLSQSRVGVYAGVMWSQYQLLGVDPQYASDGSVPESLISSVANRVSYFFDFHGPSIGLDTMCSSSLTALHMACEAMRAGEIDYALAGGVNLIVHPNKYLRLAQGNFAASDGRCRSFGAGGDGYVPGEGVGVALLKPLNKALADHDHIYGVIKATHINHGGKTNGYTVPNPVQQGELIRHTLIKAKIHPESISYVEAHGTGTALGDPIEVTGLTQAYRSSSDKNGFCALGSVKANIGHLESAAGISALSKVLLQLKHDTLVPTLNCQHENPNIDFEATPFVLQKETQPWSRLLQASPNIVRDKRRAAISSFGAGGANAHMIVEESPLHARQIHPDNVDRIFTFSAKDINRLHGYIESFIDYLKQTATKTHVPLEDIAYTLLLGRDKEPARLAVVASTHEQLLTGLTAFLNKTPSSQANWYSADLRNNQEQSALLPTGECGEAYIQSLVDHHETSKLAALWTQGADIDWSALFPDGTPYRTPLPTAPFLRERYWVERKETAAISSRVQGLHPLLDSNVSTLDQQAYKKLFSGMEPVISDHRIAGNPILPAAGYVEMVNAAMTLAAGENISQIQQLQWHAAIIVKQQPVDTRLQLQMLNDSIGFTIHSLTADGGATLCCSGEIPESNEPKACVANQTNISQLPNDISQLNFYETLAAKGFDYSNQYQSIAHIGFDENRAIATLIPVTAKTTATYLRNIAVLDAAFQSVVPLLPTTNTEVYVPAKLEAIHFYSELDQAHAVIVSRSNSGSDSQLCFDITITDKKGNALISLNQFTVAPFAIAAQESEKTTNLSGLQYFTSDWQPISIEPISTHREATTLTLNLSSMALPHKGIQLDVGNEFTANANDRFTLNIDSSDDWKSLFDKVDSKPNAAFNLIVVPPDNSRELNDLVQQFSLFKALSNTLKGRSLRLLMVQHSSANYSSALSGFVKTLAQEYTNISASTLTLPASVTDATTQQAILAELARKPGKALAAEARFEGQQLYIKQAIACTDTSATELALKNQGVYLVTGGAGGVGKLVCQYLANQYRANIVITGRSKMTPAFQHLMDELRHAGSEALYLSADVINPSDMATVIEITLARFGQLQGVIHCAGLTRDALLAHKTADDFAQVIAPKILGTEILDRVTETLNLDFFVVFSSLAAVLGNPGQVDYATGNSFLDKFARQRQARVDNGERQGKTVSINWPYWQSGGMQLSADMLAQIQATTGLEPLPTEEAINALEFALRQPNAQLFVCMGDQQIILHTLNGIDTQAEYTTTAVVSESTARPAVTALLRKLIAEETRWELDKITESDSFGTYGVDSVMTLNLTRKLSDSFGELPKTLFFEYTNIAQLCDYFISHHHDGVAALTDTTSNAQATTRHANTSAPVTAAPAKQSVSRRQYLRGNTIPASEDEPIAIIGLSGRYPQADSLQAFYQNLCMGVDAISEIPTYRWNNSHYFDTNRQNLQKGKTYSRWGGFIDDVDQFDPLFFNISPADAITMDPQERLFLESSWHTFEDAGYTTASLAGTKTGVYTGVMWSHYQLHGVDTVPEKSSKFPESSYSSIANRVSYFFELEGPSLAVDTMCSSSLTAIYLACEAIKRNDCDMALAGGINLSLHPYKYQQLSGSQFLSSDGRCRSFGEGGDGYVPGEGVGSILLKTLAKAKADGDKIYGVIKGGALNHGGNSNGYNVPNPRAQGNLIHSAIQTTGVDPASISYIEAHGTGTPLGDPIELQGLKRAFSHGDTPPQCAIGSVKSNIGHLEAASGIAGLTKVLLQMQSRSLFPSLHADTLNPNLDFSQSPFHVQKELIAWGMDNQPLTAGISSFGAGGSNAFMLVESVEHTAQQDAGVYSEIVFPFAAHNKRSLQDMVEQFTQLLTQIRNKQLPQYRDYTFESLAYTLQNYRVPHPLRLAIVTTSLDDLAAQLAAINVNDQQFPSTAYYGETVVAQPQKEAQPKAHQPQQLARYWVNGGEIDFHSVYNALNSTRVWLPPYPFAKNSYWYKGQRSRDTAHTIKHSGDSQTGALECALDFNSSMHSGLQYKAKLRVQQPLARDHEFNGQSLLPGAAYISIIANTMARGTDNTYLQLKQLVWKKPLFIREDTSLFSTYKPTTNTQYACSLWTGSASNKLEHVSAVIDSAGSAAIANPDGQLRTMLNENAKTIEKSHFYALFDPYQITYSGIFRCIESARFSDTMAESVYHISPTDLHTELAVIIDATLQSFVLLQDRNNPQAKLPFSVENIVIHRNLLDKTLEPELAGRIRIHTTGKNSGNAEVLGSDGTLLVVLSGIQFCHIEQAAQQQPPAEPDIKTGLTDQVMKVFCQHMNLDRDEITLKTAFDRLGLESVAAVNIVNDLRSLSGNIPSGYLLEHKSIETLVASLLADYGDDIHTYFSSTNAAVEDTVTNNNNIEPQPAITAEVSTVDLVAKQLAVLQDIFATAMAMSPDDFGHKVSFDKYGLESVKAMEITQELSDIYGDLPSTLLFEHQTLTSLAEFIVEEKYAICRTLGKTTDAQRPTINAPAAEVPPLPTQVPLSESDLRERVNQLADSEVDSLLNKLLGSLADSITEQNSYES